MSSDKEKALAHLDEFIMEMNTHKFGNEVTEKPRFVVMNEPLKLYTAEDLRQMVEDNHPLAPSIIQIWKITHEEIENERNKAKISLSQT